MFFNIIKQKKKIFNTNIKINVKILYFLLVMGSIFDKTLNNTDHKFFVKIIIKSIDILDNKVYNNKCCQA